MARLRGTSAAAPLGVGRAGAVRGTAAPRTPQHHRATRGGDRRLRGACSAAVAAATLVLPSGAFAFPTSRLTYARGSGAETCPDETAVRQAVAARLGYDPFFPSAEKTIVARIVRTKDELRATVELVDEHGLMRGVRELKASAAQCGELVATMALAISIAVEPSNPAILGAPASSGGDPAAKGGPNTATLATNDRAITPKAPETAAVTLRAGPEPSARADVVSRDVAEGAPSGDGAGQRTPRIEFRPGATIFGAYGTAPSPTIGFALSAALRRGAWSIQLEGRGDLPASTDASGGGQVRTSLWVGALSPCLHFDPLFVCATAWIGSLRAEGVGITEPIVDLAIVVRAANAHSGRQRSFRLFRRGGWMEHRRGVRNANRRQGRPDRLREIRTLQRIQHVHVHDDELSRRPGRSMGVRSSHHRRPGRRQREDRLWRGRTPQRLPHPNEVERTARHGYSPPSCDSTSSTAPTSSFARTSRRARGTSRRPVATSKQRSAWSDRSSRFCATRKKR